MGYTTLIILAGTGLLGACSGMVGSFAVLRRRALMGDALAHAALPGVCLAFLVVGDRHLPSMLAGALVTGVLGVMIVTGLRHGTRIKEDAAIGIVLSVFYGAGIVLSRYAQSQPGRGSAAGLDSYILGQTASMVRGDVYIIAAAALFSLLVIVVLYKEFQVVSFDPGFAHAQGWPAFLLDLLLMVLVAVTVVIGLPAVGVVLMAALLIIPAAAARFWTDRLGVMLAIAAGFGAVAGAAGTLASSRYDWAAGPSIVLAGAGVFVLSMLFGPRRGIARQLWANRQYRSQVAIDSALRRFYESSPVDSSFRTSDRKTLRILERNGWIERTTADEFQLTSAGETMAAELVLARRMFDLYLSEYAGHVTEATNAGPAGLLDQIPPELRPELERLAATRRLCEEERGVES
jgi:manganese/zinc/iron transport system permease protein